MLAVFLSPGRNVYIKYSNHKTLKAIQRMQLTQDSHFQRNELPQVGLEPTAFCVPGRCSTNWATNWATEAAQLAGWNHTYTATQLKANGASQPEDQVICIVIIMSVGLFMFSCKCFVIVAMFVMFLCDCWSYLAFQWQTFTCHSVCILIHSLYLGSWALFFYYTVYPVLYWEVLLLRLWIKFHTRLFVLVKALMKRQHSRNLKLFIQIHLHVYIILMTYYIYILTCAMYV